MKEAYICDFDGTLGDTSECVVASFEGSLQQHSLPSVERSQIVKHMGLSLPSVFKGLVGMTLSDELCDQLVETYRENYARFLPDLTKIFPEVDETLREVTERGSRVSIATSKKTRFAVQSCMVLGLDQYISLYYGDDMVTNKKPHPEMLERTLDELEVSVEDAVMIGDSTWDIDMGNAIGMDTVAVTWGAHTEEELRAARPTHVVNHMTELIDLVYE